MKRLAVAVILAAFLAATVAVTAGTAPSHPPAPPLPPPTLDNQQLSLLSTEVEIVGGVFTILAVIGGGYMGLSTLRDKREAKIIKREERFAALRKECADANLAIVNRFEAVIGGVKRDVLEAIQTHREEANMEIKYIVRYQELVSDNVERIRDDVAGCREEMGQVRARVDKIADRHWDGNTERRHG